MSTGQADHVVGVAPPQRMNRYLWLVLVSAFLAWMFDSIALNVFNSSSRRAWPSSCTRTTAASSWPPAA
jgi:hypothetical protein